MYPHVCVPERCTFTLRSLAVQAGKRAAFPHEPLEQRRGLPEARAVIAGEAFERREHDRQTDLVSVLHGSAARARKSVAIDPDDVDVARSLRDALFEDPR